MKHQRCETTRHRQREPAPAEAGLPALLTTSAVARLLRVSRRTVERLVGRGQLPFYTLPLRGGLRFSEREILDWLEQRHRELLE